MSYNLMTAIDNGTGYRYGYNGKEMDFSMHNADGEVYDFGARALDVRLGRWSSTDLFESYYAPVSPYAFGLNNPIFFVDDDDNVVVGNDGNPVTYEHADGKIIWSDNASNDVIEVGNAMLSVDFGEKAFNKWQNADTKVHITIDRETAPGRFAQTIPKGVDPMTGWYTRNSDGQYVEIDVIFYMKKIKEGPISPGNRFEGASHTEVLGAVGTHDTYHNEWKQIDLDERQDPELDERSQNPKKNLPFNAELNFRKEFNEKFPQSNENFEENMKVYKDELNVKGLNEKGKPKRNNLLIAVSLVLVTLGGCVPIRRVQRKAMLKDGKELCQMCNERDKNANKELIKDKDLVCDYQEETLRSVGRMKNGGKIGKWYWYQKNEELEYIVKYSTSGDSVIVYRRNLENLFW